MFKLNIMKLKNAFEILMIKEGHLTKKHSTYDNKIILFINDYTKSFSLVALLIEL